MNIWHYLGFGGNIVLSLVCAFQLLVNTSTYEEAFGFSSVILITIGVGLFIFSFILLDNVLKPTLKKGIEITIQDVLWILITSIVAFIFRDQFNEFGMKSLVVVNCLVFTAIIIQYASLFFPLKQASSPFDNYFEIRKKIKSNKKQFWTILSKLDDIHKYASSIDTSILKSKHLGVGTIRHCSSGNKQKWSEEVYEWKEGEAISLKFDPTVKGFPFPVERMNGGWKITVSNDSSHVAIWFQFTSQKLGLLLPLFCYLWTINLSRTVKQMDQAALSI